MLVVDTELEIEFERSVVALTELEAEQRRVAQAAEREAERVRRAEELAAVAAAADAAAAAADAEVACHTPSDLPRMPTLLRCVSCAPDIAPCSYPHRRASPCPAIASRALPSDSAPTVPSHRRRLPGAKTANGARRSAAPPPPNCRPSQRQPAG